MTMHKKDLEEKIKERVLPLLEGMLSKNLGLKIPKIESETPIQIIDLFSLSNNDKT